MLQGWLGTSLFVAGGLALFILALRLLARGASRIGPLVVSTLHIHSAANTLGFGWLLAYLVLSGTPVVSVALTFFATGALTATQTLFMI
jgi:sodium-dependent phosphate cotransporter